MHTLQESLDILMPNIFLFNPILESLELQYDNDRQSILFQLPGICILSNKEDQIKFRLSGCVDINTSKSDLQMKIVESPKENIVILKEIAEYAIFSELNFEIGV